jgi:N-acetyltransferase
LGPVSLQGSFISLEPLREEHVPGLLEAGQADEVWTHLTAAPRNPDAMRAYVAAAMQAEAEDREYAFAVIARNTGRVLGSTRYLWVDHRNRTAQVGWTWYTPDVSGTVVNPEAKLLLFRHAFENWHAIRVCLNTDVLNLHSRAAIKKLGAHEEGTLRNERIRRDGTYRDTVVFSVIESEWPLVRNRLEARLARLGS